MAAVLIPIGTERQPFRPATFSDALRSEWTKIRSVQSTYWTIFVAALLGIGLGALISGLGASRYATDPGIHVGWNPTDHSLRSLVIAQLAFGVLGVMIVTGEYSTGMIRTSLAAVPRRSRLMSAKLSVFSAIALVTGEIIAFITFLLGQALIHGKAPSASLHQHLVLRAVIGAGLYLALIALTGAALGLLLRQAAAAIAVLVALLFVLPGIAQALPSWLSNPIEQYWPTNAGTQVAMTVRDSHTMTAWLGFGEMALFVGVVLVVAFTLLERRDA
jgi:ABC-2 type transport system permease protein